MKKPEVKETKMGMVEQMETVKLTKQKVIRVMKMFRLGLKPLFNQTTH